jgi:hypothetical protein
MGLCGDLTTKSTKEYHDGLTQRTRRILNSSLALCSLWKKNFVTFVVKLTTKVTKPNFIFE